MAEQIQKKLQGELEKYQQLQKDLSKSVAARQKLEAQLTENNIVKEELELLDDTNAVFKLMGPVLVRQDMEEARATVAKRLAYITGEIKRYEQQMQEMEQKSEQRREALARLQQDLQRAQGKG
ncbi:prefoldin subunit 6 [Anser cygnoides]|uniref:prefoldin subunit 6 n=1 Tax=Anser cygnoides TaxID=8845 RepID=UPI0034D1C2A4